MSLISTASLRTWLSVPDGDRATINVKLESLINSVEDFVNNYCHRILEAAIYNSSPDYTYYDGNGMRWMYAKQYPVSDITALYIDADRLFGAGTLVSTGDFVWYPSSGKIVLESGRFTTGRRNIKIDYKAGYAPVVGGTHNAAVSSYPCPYDLTQVMTEMVVESYKEGLTAIHTVAGGDQFGDKIIKLLSTNSFWTHTLNKYKDFGAAYMGRDE